MKRKTADFNPLVETAREAMARGAYAYGVAAYERACKADHANANLLVELAQAQLKFNLIEESAGSLTHALKLAPKHADAAAQLAGLLQHHRLDSHSQLNPFGLQAAFSHEHIDHESLGRAALEYLAAETALAEALMKSQTDPSGAARALILRQTSKVLTHPLLHLALSKSVNRLPEFERLLTAMRRVLLIEIQAERFQDKNLVAFALTLIRQFWNNEHVFAVSEPERDALESISVTGADLFPKTRTASEQARRLILTLLYVPFAEAASKTTPPQAYIVLQPKALAQMLVERATEDARLTSGAAVMPSLLRGGHENPVTAAVARHYERHPYPRWLSFHRPRQGSAKSWLSGFFDKHALDFMDRGFDVLIAGAGTGQHAVMSAVRFGLEARVLAIDLSRNSLAYGAEKAKLLGISNLEFLQADINALEKLGRQFDIIESVGVLHHLHDPFAGWAALLEKLKPGGLMYIGLYSAVSRQNIHALRYAPDFPKSSATDNEARAYRASLMKVESGHPAFRLLQSGDFYSLSDFRDLVLNAHEVPLSLPEIGEFLDKQKLQFCGFTLPPGALALYSERFPANKSPGSLHDWWTLEQENTTLFDGMYRFWCRKTIA